MGQNYLIIVLGRFSPYIYPKVPDGAGTGFVMRAIENQLLVIPGNIFSRRDTHFRLSYAAGMETIQRGMDVLRQLGS